MWLHTPIDRPLHRQSIAALGTDGFGRSDTDALRKFFEVDRDHIVVATLASLGLRAEVICTIKRYEIETDTLAPWKL
jgi:pyruvate dehydrogenase E1 component